MASAGSNVSVIIPMFNAAPTIAAAVTSVLEQTRPADEILVVDNGSTDQSIAVAAAVSPMVRVLHEPMRGPAAARNRGVAEAHGVYLAFLDADDLMPPDRLALQLQHLERNPDLAMVFGRQLRFRGSELPDTLALIGARPDIVSEGPIPGAMLCRKTVFDRVGPFNLSLHLGEFFEWYARAQDAGAAAVMPEQVVLYRRIHDDNLTRDRRTVGYAYTHALKMILERRREGRQAV